MERNKIIADGITFDDVSLVPMESDVIPRDVDVSSRFTRGIPLNIPLCSAAMDTVTEALLAIALAQEGGIGVIHKNLSVEEQAREVEKVKRSENGVILEPVTLHPKQTISHARELMRTHRISGLPVLNDGKLVGILTHRDLRFQEDSDAPVAQVMTKDGLVTAPPDTTLDQAKEILHRNKVEKLLLVDDQQRLKGLITIKDIEKLTQFPNAVRDSRGRLRVGAAVGPNDDERVDALIRKDCDVIVVDTAHGHSRGVVNAVRQIKRKHDIEVVAGNVATAEGARALVEAGADGVEVGIGPGAICTTRVVAGVGIPQISAILDCAKELEQAGVTLIADGGIRYSGDIAKAIAAGADCVMVGSLFAGLDESPSEIIYYQGRPYKVFRGMGSIGAMMQGSAGRYGQAGEQRPRKLVPEGVEARVSSRGPLSDFVYQLIGGLRAGMGYCGARDVAQLRREARFVRVSPAGLAESHPHDVAITREAPNYRPE